MQIARQAAEAGAAHRHFPVIDSTNRAALEAVRGGADRLWITADRQEAGRGRHGRHWDSPVGNLYASLGLLAPCPAAQAPKLGFVAGLALAEAILRLAPDLAGRLALKWPNDCLIDGAKCAGILLEGSVLADGRQALAIGIGVNVAHHPAGLERSATRLADHWPPATCEALFAALSERMALGLAAFGDGSGFAAIRNGWLRHALPAGTPLRVRPPGGERQGRFAGMDEAGHLRLETAAGTETILAGDVFLAVHEPAPCFVGGRGP